MKKHLLIISLCCLLFPNVFAQSAERVFTLDESISTGLKNNQKMLVLQEQISLAKQRINEARALTYPKIDFNFNISQFNNNMPTVLAPSFYSVYLPGDNKEQYYSTRFSLWQYLYAGGRYTTNLRVAEANLSSAESQYDVIKNEAVRDVKKSFYNFLVLSEKLKVYQDAIKAVDKKNKSYRSKLELKLLEVKHEYKKAKLDFLDIVGVELNTEIEIYGELKAPNDEYELSKCLAWAFEYRPELSETQFKEKIDSLRVNLSMTERYPTITLGANYEWVGDQFPLPEKNWSATINLNVPIFDGWASWARIKQRKLKVREGKIYRVEIEDKIRLEVRHAYLDYNYWRERMSGLESEKSTLVDTEKKLNNRIVWLDTIKDLLFSHAELEKAIGKPLSELK
ncbi:MAG: TolC family protein [Endomicrobiales bacterium]|nr:TolC family protein [Endomicrobiales bacterium]